MGTPPGTPEGSLRQTLGAAATLARRVTRSLKAAASEFKEQLRSDEARKADGEGKAEGQIRRSLKAAASEFKTQMQSERDGARKAEEARQEDEATRAEKTTRPQEANKKDQGSRAKAEGGRLKTIVKAKVAFTSISDANRKREERAKQGLVDFEVFPPLPKEEKPASELQKAMQKRKTKLKYAEEKLKELNAGYTAEEIASWNAQNQSTGGYTLEEYAAWSGAQRARKSLDAAEGLQAKLAEGDGSAGSGGYTADEIAAWNASQSGAAGGYTAEEIAAWNASQSGAAASYTAEEIAAWNASQSGATGGYSLRWH